MFEQCAIIFACGSGHHTTLLWGRHHISATAVGFLLLHTLHLEVGALIKQLTGKGCCCCAMTLFFCMPRVTLSHLTSAMVAWGTLIHTLQLEVRVLLDRKEAAAVTLADPSPCAWLAVCLTPLVTAPEAHTCSRRLGCCRGCKMLLLPCHAFISGQPRGGYNGTSSLAVRPLA